MITPRVVAAFAAAISVLLVATASASAQTPPQQPSGVPGGGPYPWANAETIFVDKTGMVDDYWIVRPQTSQNVQLPLIVFLHGYQGNDPSYYQTWLTHLARMGNVVVFPRYQMAITPVAQYTPNAIKALKDALTRLAGMGGPKPDVAKGSDLVGHSYGGVVATNIASRSNDDAAIPDAKALLAAHPWDNRDNAYDQPQTPPIGMKLVCVVGDDDEFAYRRGCDVIFELTSSSGLERNYAWMFSQTRGGTSLTTNHFAPNATTSSTDALDWYGFWKIADGLRDCTLATPSTNCQYALGNTPEQRFMGEWSDGCDVPPLNVQTAKPNPDPAPPPPDPAC